MMKTFKRLIALMLCLFLCVSLLPAAAFANGEDGEPDEQQEQTQNENDTGDAKTENGSETDPGQNLTPDPDPDQNQNPDPAPDQNQNQNPDPDPDPDQNLNQNPDPDPDPENSTGEGRIAVSFLLEPEGTSLTVYDAEGNELAPEDSVYMLLPGTYSYDACLEGYVPLIGVPFTVTAETTTVSVTLTAAEPENGPDRDGSDGENENEKLDGEEPKEEKGEEPAAAELLYDVSDLMVADGSGISTDDPDALFSTYVDKTLHPRPKMRGSAAQNGLSGVNATAYSLLSGYIAQVASGDLGYTVIPIPVEDLGFSKTVWTREEFGVDIVEVVDGKTQVTQQARERLGQLLGTMINTQTILSALLADKPYELYWFNKVHDASSGTGGMFSDYQFSYYLDGSAIMLAGDYSFYFSVAREYCLYGNNYTADSQFYFNTAVGQSVQTTLTTAQNIVAEFESSSDMEKLRGYKTRICDLVSYNSQAANNSATPYGNPWQMIWVFDGDPSTNVVCEGYSKAFQYLCDLTSFADSSIRCIAVDGKLDGGAHMWNIVRWSDGLNYLVDVTNCDGTSIGAPWKLFMVRADGGNMREGYVFEPSSSLLYQYSASVKSTFASSDLTLVDAVGSGSCGSDVLWSLDDAGVLNITGEGAMANYTSYSSNRAPWYGFAESITAIKIGSGVTSIGDYAFSGCANMTDTTVYGSALTRIGSYAFSGCSTIINVTIPASVTSIGNRAFYNCTALRSLSVAEGNTAFCAENGVLFNADKSTLIQYPTGKRDASYTVPATVRTIEGVFAVNPYLQSVTIPASVTSMSTGMFQSCTALESATIQATVTKIGNYFFNGCRNLTSVTIPAGVTEIGSNAFAYCESLPQIQLPAGVTTIGDYAFNYCSSLTSLAIPTSAASIGTGAFQKCGSLTEITVAQDNASYCSADGVLFDKSMSTLIQYPSGKTDASYTVPASVTSIAANAFSLNGLLSGVTIPAAVSSIGTNAFYLCGALAAISVAPDNAAYSSADGVLFDKNKNTLISYPAGKTADAYTVPASVTSIANYAFCDCSSLTSIRFEGSAPSFGANSFYRVEATAYYPEGDASWTAELRKNYGGTLTWAPAAIKTITATGECGIDGDNLIWTLYSDGELVIEGSGEMMNRNDTPDNSLYDHTTEITTVTILDGATNIGTAVFGAFKQLSSVTIPESVTSIDPYAFQGCSALTSVSLPSGVSEIGGSAFCVCTGLGEITLPAALTYVGDTAFFGCSALTNVYFGGSESMWNAISVGVQNDPLLTATIHYLPVFASHSLLLSGEIGVKFYMDLSCLSAAEKNASYMSFTVSGAAQTDAFDALDTNPGGNGWNGFTCYVNSVQMADTITAVFHYGEGKSVTQTYSVKDYIDYVNDNPSQYSSSVRALVAATASYGASVQPFLAASNGWQLGSAHTAMTGAEYFSQQDFADIRNESNGFAFGKDLGDSHVSKVSYSLDLQSKTTLYLFFKLDPSYRGAVSATLDGAAADLEKLPDGRYRLAVSNIAAHELGTAHTIAVAAGGTCTVTISALSYVNAALSSTATAFDNNQAKAAVASLYRYYSEANAYLAAQNNQESDRF